MGLLQVPDKAPKKKAKKKGTIADSLAVLRSSPKTMNLALLVMSYGVSHRLFEFAWKGQLRALYPSAQAYQVGLGRRRCSMRACLPLSAVIVVPIDTFHADSGICQQNFKTSNTGDNIPRRACWQMCPLPLAG